MYYIQLILNEHNVTITCDKMCDFDHSFRFRKLIRSCGWEYDVFNSFSTILSPGGTWNFGIAFK